MGRLLLATSSLKASNLARFVATSSLTEPGSLCNLASSALVVSDSPFCSVKEEIKCKILLGL